MKIIVLDDDPTGSQSVYGCPLLLKWDQESLRIAFESKSDLFFIIANTRAMLPELAVEITSDICFSILQAAKICNILMRDIIIISRGDSTLRGHGYLEPKIIDQILGPFNATIHVPAFFEGNRITIDGVHYLNDTPVHLTEFAKDSIFGYSTSNLDKWLEEKSSGIISAKNVKRINIQLLEKAEFSQAGMNCLLDNLLALYNNQPVIIDAEEPLHLNVLSKAIIKLIGRKRFLFRSAASLIKSLAAMKPNPLNTQDLMNLRLKSESGRDQPGLIIVGSHVPLSNSQLSILLEQNECEGIELSLSEISKLISDKKYNSYISELESIYVHRISEILLEGKTPIFYTSRVSINFNTYEENIKFGNLIADFMAHCAGKLQHKLSYIISKGGTTSYSLLLNGLGSQVLQLHGQLLPGLSIVTPEKSVNVVKPRKIPVVTFPGNFGNEITLLETWRLLNSSS